MSVRQFIQFDLDQTFTVDMLDAWGIDNVSFNAIATPFLPASRSSLRAAARWARSAGAGSGRLKEHADQNT